MLGFTSPLLLIGLVALPLLWWLLRAIPPAPIRRAFPGVILLLGLDDRDNEARRTPLWLLLLRMAALAAMIIGFAGPVLNPEPQSPGTGPILVLIDDSWAAAPDWQVRLTAANRVLRAARTAGRPVALVTASAPPQQSALPLRSADDILRRLSGLAPQPYTPGHDTLLNWVETLDTRFDTLWMSDGLASPDRTALARVLTNHGTLSVQESPAPRLGLLPAGIEGSMVLLTALRSQPGPAQEITITGIGPDPSGTERELARTTLSFAVGETRAEAQLSLPPELRNRISCFRIEGNRSAGAITLADDSLHRRKVGLVSSSTSRETLDLLSPGHYLRAALTPTAEVIDGALPDLIAANPDAILLPDIASLAPSEADALVTWVSEGGLLLRFAGPRLATTGTDPGQDDPLLPVHLRAGGRDVGGAMSWGDPQNLAPFPEQSPFYGLAIPDDVTVSSQVLAEPGPELASRTIAALADGTPLVTRKALGSGQVVLFHSSANAEWSSLALSGLFVQMLERLAVTTKPGPPDTRDMVGTIWVPEQHLDGFGVLQDAGDSAGLPGERLTNPPGPDLLPGLYRSGEKLTAVNTLGPDAILAAARWPAGITPEWQDESQERDLVGPLLLIALQLLGLDIVATLALSGRLRVAKGAVMGLGVVLAMSVPDGAQAAPGIMPDHGSSLFWFIAVSTGVFAVMSLRTVAGRRSEQGKRLTGGWRVMTVGLRHLCLQQTAVVDASRKLHHSASPSGRSGACPARSARTGLELGSPQPHHEAQNTDAWPICQRKHPLLTPPPQRRRKIPGLIPSPLRERVRAGVMVPLITALTLLAAPTHAQDISPATLAAAEHVTLAYVITGDAGIDRISQAGLSGLSDQLTLRTSVEPAAPAGVDLETDDLSVFPLLYWPVTPNQPQPSASAYGKLNAYLRTGGMILFDTRDGDITASGASATPEATRLRALARPLDIPPLEPVPADHVLTRAFYLLSAFPGRYQGAPVWVEAAPADAARAEGMPFRNLNDGVTPVVIGGNDWAGAWAVAANSAAMLPVGRGTAGERQREMAYRFGVNLVMHVLSGNYKSDQVHVPALLERLGE